MIIMDNGLLVLTVAACVAGGAIYLLGITDPQWAVAIGFFVGAVAGKLAEAVGQ